MHVTRNRLPIRQKLRGGWLLLLFIAGICVAFSMTSKNEFDFARREVLLRRIGHEILLQSGDSTSRVLPVNKIAENEYQISFEQAFTFKPESLVQITRQWLAKAPYAGDYIVNVLTCDNATVTYGYAISNDKKDDIIACTGRVQPKACYKINIQFRPTGINTTRNRYILGGLSLLAFAGFIFLRYGKSQKVPLEVPTSGTFKLGAVLFDPAHRKLVMDGKTIDLTVTETRVLLIFASAPNEIIERSRLQKEIWEDAGVIVGRSLDMFISKLRKKLESDPDIKIVVVRGKGYKLELNG